MTDRQTPNDFYQRGSIASYASAGIATAEMSVRPSVCLSESRADAGKPRDATVISIDIKSAGSCWFLFIVLVTVDGRKDGVQIKHEIDWTTRSGDIAGFVCSDATFSIPYSSSGGNLRVFRLE